METRILLTLAVSSEHTCVCPEIRAHLQLFRHYGATIFTATPPSTTGTTLCTDFFGKGNYANSPLPAGPIDTVTGFTIVDGGSGYTAPVVTIGDALGTPTNGIPVAAASCSRHPDWRRHYCYHVRFGRQWLCRPHRERDRSDGQWRIHSGETLNYRPVWRYS